MNEDTCPYCGNDQLRLIVEANAPAEHSAASADMLRRDVGPCPICGDPGCLGNECEAEPEEPDDDLCDQCGQPSGCLLNGLCPMCYETGGGVLHRRSNARPHAEAVADSVQADVGRQNQEEA